MNLRTGKFYLSGPMNGCEGLNFESFHNLEARIKEQFPEAVILNPAKHPEGLEYEEYMLIDLAMVEVCDHVVLLPGWENSPGAQRERSKAVNLGKNLIRAEHFLCKHPKIIECGHNGCKKTY